MRVDPNLLIVFLTVADRGSLTAAACQLDVTRSAVSQSLRRLEDQLGTALVVRTTRSARLTEAGERLRERLAGPFGEIGDALDALADPTEPTGLLRLAVASIAERILSGPLIAGFARSYPGIKIDVTGYNDAVARFSDNASAEFRWKLAAALHVPNEDEDRTARPPNL